MLTAVMIDPACWYDDTVIHREMQISSDTLAKARRSGHLKSSRRGGRYLYLGSWLNTWLADEAAPAQAVAE